jgi:kinesin family protein 13
MSVIVAVRVRPFNAREQKIDSQLCVEMQDNQTILINEEGKKRVFAFDHSFWSHDNFQTDKEGNFVPTSKKYADQQIVYNKVGKQVLKNAMDGYHCCLFAYGQTGSGKSYSMIGYGPNRGIVPIISEEIFKLINVQTSSKKWFEVNVSMQEIYNEKIQDLLIPINKRPTGGLKVRESQSVGVYVDGLTKHPVDCYEAIERKMSEGNHNRTIASTQMNSCSSRAHTIITIEFKQIEKIEGKKVQRFSVINLVDLAGSEKVSKTGAKGDRLKEGCSINKSLTVLGKVISTLAEMAMDKKNKNIVVPYRESSLTRILQNALGGNSKTLMICAISPSGDNYEETLSTLRYADQAKKIKCHAVVNESEADKKIRMLQNENNELKLLLQQLQSGNGNFKNIVSFQGDTNLQSNPDSERILKEKQHKEMELQQKIIDLEETLQANNMMMEEYAKTFEEKLKEEKSKEVIKKKEDYSVPHLTNLNEDPLLSGKIYHNLEEKKSLVVGRKKKDFIPDIFLMGIGLQQQHALIQNRDGKFFLIPGCKEAQNFLFLNGDKVKEEQQLFNWDRITFGISTIFIFKNPYENTPPRGSISDEAEIDWERCQLENQKNIQQLPINPETGMRRQSKYIEIESECMRLKEEYSKKIQEMEMQHKNKLDEYQNQLNNTSFNENLIQMEMEEFEEFKKEFEDSYEKRMELEKTKKEDFEREYLKEFKENDKKKLEETMYSINPNIIEANLIAQELNRNISFKPYINYYYMDMENIKAIEKKKKFRIKIQVDNHELGYSYFWDINKFTSRYFLIRELLDQFYITEEIVKPSKEEDPFWDPPEPQLIGEGYLKLMSLAYLLDNPNQLIIVGDEGKIATLEVNIEPVDESGDLLDEDHPIFDNFIDDPKDLFGHRVDFIVSIG